MSSRTYIEIAVFAQDLIGQRLFFQRIDFFQEDGPNARVYRNFVQREGDSEGCLITASSHEQNQVFPYLTWRQRLSSPPVLSGHSQLPSLQTRLLTIAAFIMSRKERRSRFPSPCFQKHVQLPMH
jgi:hypothetical protein